MAKAKTFKLDLSVVLQALDRKDLEFYNRLSDEDKKGYTPLVLMRYMSSLTEQNQNKAYAIIATNDLVNIGFWELSKHVELQHKLLCLAGLGGKQYRPWISTSRNKKASKIDEVFQTIYSEYNEDEISIIKSQCDKLTFEKLVYSLEIDPAKSRDLIKEWAKLTNE